MKNLNGEKVLLIILDGFGEGKKYKGNAVTLAKTPTLTALKKHYPWTLLKASGEAVGIPAGMQGGSEVGHFTIGAGRVVFQSVEEINRSIKKGDFFKKKAFKKACNRVNKGEKAALHLIGMISDQGVHSHIGHLFALLELAKREKAERVYIHAITDGRDVPERSADKFIKQILDKISELGMQKQAKVATIIGRYFSMDRDSNWLRTQKAYDLYTLGAGVKESDPLEALKNAYDHGVETDYYIYPIILDDHKVAPTLRRGINGLASPRLGLGVIKDKDSVIFWNYRTDRARQLTWAFTGEHDLGFKPKKKVKPYFVCMGPYSHTAPVVFPTHAVKNNLAGIISKSGLSQFRIAETEKYAHVTFFFNSQIETPCKGEKRLMMHSPKCPSYAQKPEMSAREITSKLLPVLDKKTYGFIVLNFANCDLVGHSGDLKASIKAVEVVDECLGKIIPAALKNDYFSIVTSDHGNIEYKIYEKNGDPCPSHSTNPVPCIFVGRNSEKMRIKRKNGELQDKAPTVLKIMGIKKPKEMTGKSLV